MLSVAPFFEKNSTAAAFSHCFSIRFSNSEKYLFLPTLPARSKEKMRPRFSAVISRKFGTRNTEILKCG
jgi:hypothetical protein